MIFTITDEGMRVHKRESCWDGVFRGRFLDGSDSMDYFHPSAATNFSTQPERIHTAHDPLGSCGRMEKMSMPIPASEDIPLSNLYTTFSYTGSTSVTKISRADPITTKPLHSPFLVLHQNTF